jgi:hypothetical protein
MAADNENLDVEITEVVGETNIEGAQWSPFVGEITQSLLAKVPDESQSTVRDESVAILAKCIPPTIQSGRETGLVVGYVQSGKTLSFTTVAALARDNGYHMVVVITGTSSLPLLHQSTGRLKDDLDIPCSAWKLFTSDALRREDRRIIESALERWNDPGVAEVDRQTLLFVVMKDCRHLDRTITVLQSLANLLEGCPVLVIDDEADYAGLNSKVRQAGESATYQRLLRLRNCLPHHSYLQYTATPQAALLINIIDTLSPNFVQVLTPGPSYTGGRVFFEGDLRLIQQIPIGDIPGTGNQLQEPPDSLLQAMRLYILGVAARLATGSRPQNRSMMIHPTRRTHGHADFYHWVTNIIDRWEATLALPESDPDRIELIDEFRQDYQELADTVSDIPIFERLSSLLYRAIRETNPQEVNRRQGPTQQPNWQRDDFHILIGGQAFDRGYTIEGLTITYMPRNVGVGNADTIQQRARWFGYKSGYLGYCRVFLSAGAITAYRGYVEHEEDMRQRLREHHGSLREWKRAFFLDARLRPTRNSVFNLDYIRGSFSNDWFSQKAPHTLEDACVENREVFARFIAAHLFRPNDGHPDRLDTHRHQVCRVSLREALVSLLTQLRVVGAHDSLRYTGLLLQVSRYLEINPDAMCTVYRIRPDIATTRGIDENMEISQLFQGAYPVSTKDVYPGDRAIRTTGELTVQLHTLQLYVGNDRGTIVATDVPTIAVWVPAEYNASWIIQDQP